MPLSIISNRVLLQDKMGNILSSFMNLDAADDENVNTYACIIQIGLSVTQGVLKRFNFNRFSSGPCFALN